MTFIDIFGCPLHSDPFCRVGIIAALTDHTDLLAVIDEGAAIHHRKHTGRHFHIFLAGHKTAGTHRVVVAEEGSQYHIAVGSLQMLKEAADLLAAALLDCIGNGAA